MKTSSELCNKPFEESVPGPGEAGREAVFSRGRAVTVTMNGRAASPGTATGRVAMIMHRDDIARVKEGTVIVARTASPELVMGMSKARAIATECGGQGAAASWFAREYGIPAVVGVADLIKTVGEGDLVRVDGTKGTVEILVPHM